MSTLKKLNYLFDRKVKVQIFFLLFLITMGAFMELIGVAIIFPIVEIAMGEANLADNKMSNIIMMLTGSSDKNVILLWMIALTITIYIIKDCYLVFMNNRLYAFSANTKRQMATRLMSAYLKQPYSFFLQKNTSELIRSVNSDTSQLYEVVLNCLQIASNGLTALGLVIYLSSTNLIMTLTVALLLAICAFLIIFVLQKRFRRYGLENQKISGFLIRYLQQAFEGVKEIKILNNERHFIRRYSEAYQEQSNILIKFSLFNLIPKYLIEVVCMSGILGYLAINIVNNPNYMEIMPQIAVFCVSAYKLLPSVNALYSYTNTVIYNRASIDLVYNDIKEADQLEQSFEHNRSEEQEFIFKDKIEIKDVSFCYNDNSFRVLDHVNLTIKKGESVAFIGASGGGKTTLADNILSILEPIEGTILVDGEDVRNNIWGWRKKVGYIPQLIYLTDDTIKNNVAFGVNEKDIDEKEVWRALRDAQLEEFVLGLKDGIETIVGERGTRISGGQRQRIGIARALYRNPEVLVFDEATSALDNETEKEVMKAIEGLQGTKTMIMIAHRLSTIENCDSVYQVEKGSIEKKR
ncbi:MAG: ABC transporter ATP-binding protein/permease [Lachnospiraceae bacterium]|nr:ABC transporter ATP-binding protein/permease [Lachnospiraceae bacterium]